MLELIATENDAGQRIDKFLAGALPELSRSRLQALIESGHVLCQTAPVDKKYRLRPGDVLSLRIPPPAPSELIPVAMDLSVLFEDEAMLVLHKPAGLIVHSGNGTRGQATLVQGLLAHCAGDLSGIGGVERPGIVHRLDKETSGVMVVAKSDAAHRALSAAFAGREVQKWYHALVQGCPALLSGVIREPIGRHPVHRHKMAVVEEEKGREARTDWKRLRVLEGPAALVECQLHTGRTHQIRVHLSHLGFPLLGDTTYGYDPRRWSATPAPRVMLHSHHLHLHHPLTGQEMSFTAPYPKDFADHLKALTPSDG